MNGLTRDGDFCIVHFNIILWEYWTIRQVLWPMCCVVVQANEIKWALQGLRIVLGQIRKPVLQKATQDRRVVPVYKRIHKPTAGGLLHVITQTYLAKYSGAGQTSTQCEKLDSMTEYLLADSSLQTYSEKYPHTTECEMPTFDLLRQCLLVTLR